MSMSRKDFELLARTMKDTRESTVFFGGKETLVDEVSKHLADAINGHCSGFDKARFLKACGVPQ